MSEVPLGVAPLRQFAEHEHRDIRACLPRLREVADSMARVPATEFRRDLGRVLDWCVDVLEPHMQWEDASLYPGLDRAAGTPWATKTMRFEHRQIRSWVAQLAADVERIQPDRTTLEFDALRADLYGLFALLTTHVEREDWFLVPILDADRHVRDAVLVPTD